MAFSILLLSLVFGSFIGMLVYRLPKSISLINPKRSCCPNCKKIISWYENIPIFSYIYLKAKCSNCNVKISKQYFLIESITVMVSLILFQKYGLTLNFLFILLLFYTLIILSFIDYEYKMVPDYLLILALIISTFIENYSFYSALLFAGGIVILEIFVTFYIQNIKYKFTKNENLITQRSLGEGDIPIVTIIGGVLSLQHGIIAIVMASVFAIIPAIGNLLLKKDIETPFIPYLTLGLFCVLIFENYIYAIFD